MKNNKVLVLGNPLNHEGGMVVFNKGLINTLNTSQIKFKLIPVTVGSRMSLFYYKRLKSLIYPFVLIFDLFLLAFKMSDENVKIIQSNPSLIPVPLIRDGIIQILNVFFFKKKSIIVLHGWKEHIYKSITKSKLLKYLIKSFFNSADTVFVLSSDFRNKLIKLGINESKIEITRTFFYDKDISLTQNLNSNDIIKFIFLGRVSKLKGIDELIDAFEIVIKSRNDFECQIIGHGDKHNVEEYFTKKVNDKKLSEKIKFLGRKEGSEKFSLLKNADIYVFPSYMEGCPTSVIEALASGLFIISTDVGALDDIIHDRNGIKIKPKNVNELSKAIIKSMDNIKKIRSIKNQISIEAGSKYEIKKIANQFNKVYLKLSDE